MSKPRPSTSAHRERRNGRRGPDGRAAVGPGVRVGPASVLLAVPSATRRHLMPRPPPGWDATESRGGCRGSEPGCQAPSSRSAAQRGTQRGPRREKRSWGTVTPSVAEVAVQDDHASALIYTIVRQHPAMIYTAAPYLKVVGLRGGLRVQELPAHRHTHRAVASVLLRSGPTTWGHVRTYDGGAGGRDAGGVAGRVLQCSACSIGTAVRPGGAPAEARSRWEPAAAAQSAPGAISSPADQRQCAVAGTVCADRLPSLVCRARTFPARTAGPVASAREEQCERGRSVRDAVGLTKVTAGDNPQDRVPSPPEVVAGAEYGVDAGAC